MLSLISSDWTDTLHFPTFQPSVNHVFLHDYRNLTLITVSAILTSFALSTTATIVPGLLALAAFHLCARCILPSIHAKRNIILFILAIAAGSAVPNLSASREALDTRALSLLLLTGLSSLTSAIVVGVLYVDWRFSRVYPERASLLFFPALWTTTWRTVAYFSPVGHLLTWTRPNTVEGYRWLLPIVGPLGQDWIMAAWAVVLSQVLQTWYMGPEPIDDESCEELATPSTFRRAQDHPSSSTKMLAAGLVGLLIPSFFLNTQPLPVSDIETTTPLTVGCILPTFQRYKHHAPTLDDYITETAKYHSSARLLLWPEGAVSFDSDSERDAAFDLIRSSITGSYVGVSFEQYTTDPDDPRGHKAYKRTGLAVIHKDSPKPYLTYYKRHLVPIAESYHLNRSPDPPSLVNLKLPTPKGIPPSRWNPTPGHSHRDFSITASICLDFAFPVPFGGISSRPDLILAPARTWERSVGISMWQQAKQRANELNSVVLWCDGGEGGVSGVGGGGYEELNQVGSGSWIKTIGMEYPLKAGPSIYARLEDSSVLVYWLMTGLGLIKFRKRRQAAPLLQNGGDHPNLIDSRFARGLRGSFRSSTLKSPADFVHSLSRRFAGNKELEPPQQDLTDDYHIVTQDDLPTLTSPCPGDSDNNIPQETSIPPSIEYKSTHKLDLKTAEEYLSARHVSIGPVSARSTQASSAFSDLADIASSFPSPPTYIPSPRTPFPPAQAFSIPPARIERSQSSATTTRESVFSIDRFRNSVKRIFKTSLRIPSFKKPVPESDPLPPPPTIVSTVAEAFQRTTNQPTTTNPPVIIVTPEAKLIDRVNAPEPIFRTRSSFYELVDPSTLTASPEYHPKADFITGSTRSLIPPSHSWLASKFAEFENNHNVGIGLSSELERQIQKVPIVSFPASSQVSLSSTASAPLSPLEVNEVQHFGSRIDIQNIYPVPLDSRSTSIQSRLSFATANSNFSIRNMDFTGKGNDVIDYGGDYDYTGQNWFQERPPRPEPPPPPPQPQTPYVPSQTVIEQNEAFLFALESAPNMLYSRFKQFGQLGVLGWCAEFSEMIDHLKDLGFNGNMFVATRSQALKTCEEVLKLNLEIRMQIIVLYLSYQVSRLRRFLDSEGHWEDYPEVQFPLNPGG
ncbi:hypothetical protein FA15DRAFT_751836 [Coprinopsis marcescibilis]|uniref:CN hydrolase domain-containing protein n=1 Tax=Coprinopsis marcescibilis TaxID=230819 RepID=A0A5C3LCN7_COPMA|nr:hypothetical protein FA15DRAFT_751836 [Coprinopsis marcescibilis]